VGRVFCPPIFIELKPAARGFFYIWRKLFRLMFFPAHA
jgi:hypothetical protein